uniref:G-protein coupled receptors family 2 profile 2 domain-containing protein n=1 Tax=Ciona savignyi TaxID=51511 RepID=H2YNE1_CIOSA
YPMFYPQSKGDGYWSSDGCNVTWISSNQTICNCSHLTNFAVLLDVYGGNRVISPLHEFILRVLTYVGCGLSIAGLFITLLSYVIFGKIRRDAPAKILICLCISLIAVNLFYLGLSPAYFYSSCVVVSVLLHYFLLSSLTWMGLEALNMYIALIRVFNTYYRKYILKISLAGWGIPLIVVLISLLLHFFKQPDQYEHPIPIRHLFSPPPRCWIQNQVFYGCLVAPFAIIFTFNCIIFCLVLAQLLGLGSLTRPLFIFLNSFSGLMALLGITWGLAFISIGDASLPLSYLFVIFNSTQGSFWVFVFHCLLKKDISNHWLKLLKCQKQVKNSGS